MPKIMFLSGHKYAIIAQEWYLPRHYKSNPPPGNKYILWSCCIPWPYDGLIEDLSPPPVEHYNFTLRIGTTKPRRKFSAEAKARIRKQRLTDRIMKKDPLFAYELIQRAIAEKPDYFNPGKIAEEDKKHQEYMKKVEQEWVDQFVVK